MFPLSFRQLIGPGLSDHCVMEAIGMIFLMNQATKLQLMKIYLLFRELLFVVDFLSNNVDF